MQKILTDWRPELVECIRFLHQRGYAPATSSNYSYRPEGDLDFYISVSGIDKGQFTAQHFMQVNLEGRPLEDNRKPSAETLLHALIYRKLPKTQCVLHTHTVFNTVISTIHQDKVRLEGFEVLKGLSGITTHETAVDIPIFENSQNMPELAASIEAYWAKNAGMPGFLLAGHGLYTWGNSIAEAKRHIEVLEFLFEVVYRIEKVNS